MVFKKPSYREPRRVAENRIPAVGRDFDIEEVRAATEHVKALAAHNTATTRNRLAVVLTGLSTLAVLYGGWVGVMTGDWARLQGVWAVVGPIIGGRVGFYFRRE